MSTGMRTLAAITILNGAFAALSFTQLHPASAADDRIADVLRGRKLEIVDATGRVRASIQVHTAKPPEEDSVVLRMNGTYGPPRVKLGASDHSVGLALIREEGHYVQVFPDGVKITADGRQRASWP